MTERLVFQSDRQFRLWKYSVSHGQLLLRSPSGPEHRTCVDVLFKVVRSISIETEYDGLRVWRTDDMSEGEQVVFRLQSSDHVGSIKAAVAFALESEIGYHDDGALWAGIADSSMPVHHL